MNPLKALKDAYSALDRWVSTTVDRIEAENVARLKRREAYEAQIAHRRDGRGPHGGSQ